MTFVDKAELYSLLENVNHSRKKRMSVARLLLDNKELVLPMLEIGLEVDNPISCKACWVLEFTARQKLTYIFPHLDVFTSNLSTIHIDSSVRPIAKICELLVVWYYSKGMNTTKKALTNKHLEKITEVCFDWLIGDLKVAPKAYSMTCLLLLGKTFDWVHPELKMIVEQDYTTGSAAYKARARMILAKIK